MRAFRVTDEFGIENIRATRLESVPLKRHQVRLKMIAATLNYRDLLMVQGHYNPRQPLPFVPLSDGVGTVVETGADVTRVAIGARVCPLFAQGWYAGEMSRDTLGMTLGGPIDGTLQDEMVVDAESVVAVPTHLSSEEAAALPCASLTAWSALVTLGSVKAGDEVLVLGTGGVSIAALQFAKALGARVFVTSSSDEKLERARSLGADEAFNYKRDPSWGKSVRKLTGGRGVDHVVEVGGVGTLEQSLRAVRTNGCVSLIGVLAGTSSPLSLLPALMNNIRIQGVFVGHRQSFEAMNRCIVAHAIRPVVSSVHAADDISEAFQTMANGAHFGKIAVRLCAPD